MNTIRELKQQEKYNNMLKRKNKEISILKDDKEHLGEFLKESNEEIERLNNIINELEKYIKTDAKIELYKDVSGFRTFVDRQDLLNKLQELKGEDKE